MGKQDDIHLKGSLEEVSIRGFVWVVLQTRAGSLLASFLIRVPYYLGDLERDPDLENYPRNDIHLYL